MNMIEKLGITPIDLDDYENVDHAIGKPIRELEQQRNEMLEALIKIYNSVYVNQFGDYCITSDFQDAFEIIGPLIQKATDKTWQEIKELIND